VTSDLDSRSAAAQHPGDRCQPSQLDPLRLTARLRLKAAGRRNYDCRLIRAGRIRRADNTPGPYEIPAEAIQAAVGAGKFSSKAAFVDHAGWFEGPSLRNLAGITLDAAYNATDQAAEATIRLYDNPAGNIVASLFDQVLQDAQQGEPIPDIGLSLVFYPRWKPRTNGTPASTDEPLVLAEFRHVESVDFVFQPAADGRVRDALTALSALYPWGYRTGAGAGRPPCLSAPTFREPRGPHAAVHAPIEAGPRACPPTTERHAVSCQAAL
jgi:hypothetical protein